MKKNKYYIVPSEIMESNFPDEFENGIYPGSILTTIHLSEAEFLALQNLPDGTEED